jgi:hypothetical protein
LHFFLKLDLLLSLVIGILSSDFLKLFKVIILTFTLLGHVVGLKFGVLSEKLGNFFTVSLNDLTSFSDESSFNVFNLIMIVLAHIIELLSHGFDELINVIIILLNGLDVFLILVLELINELLDQNIFLFDDLLACLLLNLNVSC